MAKFIKRPVIIDAWPVKELFECFRSNWKALPFEFKEAYETGMFLILPDSIEIRTLEGTMTAQLDDFLIMGVQGEFYPCKPDIFEQTYRPA
jgi:hypothetical protein